MFFYPIDEKVKSLRAKQYMIHTSSRIVTEIPSEVKKTRKPYSIEVHTKVSKRYTYSSTSTATIIQYNEKDKRYTFHYATDYVASET